MNFPVRHPLHVLLVFPLIVSAAVIQEAAFAQAYPNKPVRVVVPFAPGTPEQFGDFIRSEDVRWSGVIKTSGIKPD